jgi:hypothetical protein
VCGIDHGVLAGGELQRAALHTNAAAADSDQVRCSRQDVILEFGVILKWIGAEIMDQAAGSKAKAIPINVDGLVREAPTVYARSVTGIFNNWRWAMVFLTQALFYGLCWLEWGGRQAVLFHIVERKFYIFGMVFWPQDVIYLAILLVISAYGLFLVTAVGGRSSAATPARRRCIPRS